MTKPAAREFRREAVGRRAEGFCLAENPQGRPEPTSLALSVLRWKELDNRMDDLSTPRPVLEVAIGTLMLIVIIFVHGAGIRTINQRFSKSWVGVNSTTAYWRLNLLLATTIGS